MTAADDLVADVARTLKVRPGDPPKFYFAEKPKFIARRLLDLSAPDRRRALERVAVFAYFLSNEKNSPEAGYALLTILEEVAKKDESTP